MHLEYFLNIFNNNNQKDAIIWQNEHFSYQWLLSKYHFYLKEIEKYQIPQGTVVIIQADFSPKSIVFLLVLIKIKAIIVPITESIKSKKNEFIRIAEGEVIIKIDYNDNFEIKHLNKTSDHFIYKKLKKRKNPGLVLFSSGSTGQSKASVHDLSFLLKKFQVKRHTLVTITFLLYDHIGGLNTLFYVLSNGGTIVTVQDRKPSKVLELIEKYNVELLPTSPTFLNLVLISEDYKNYNLNSLKIITYGTEPMPKSTLEKYNRLFPKVKLLQTYGLSEIGILRSKSKSSDSLWVKIGGEEFKTRIVNGMLEIKSKSSMLGYLNAPSPFTEDGWFKTGDTVQVKGEYIKILGRKSDIINVGGEKVYPQEVENIILKMDEVADVLVFGEKNVILGNIVCAKIKLKNGYKNDLINVMIKNYCSKKLEKYKIPVKIKVIEQDQYSGRFKKLRKL